MSNFKLTSWMRFLDYSMFVNMLDHVLNMKIPWMITIAVMIVFSNHIEGQTVSYYNLRTNTFPKITADYIAIDALREPYGDLTAADFKVIETTPSGKVTNLSPTVTHKCRDLDISSSTSVVLVIDNSWSMKDPIGATGTSRMDMVKLAVRTFLERLRWDGVTAVSIISFAGDCRLVSDWETGPAPLIEKLNKIQPAGSTRYELPFEVAAINVFDLMAVRPPHIRKTVIFLTDGQPNPPIKDPEGFMIRTAGRCLQENIRVIAVTIPPALYTHFTLDYIANQSGGKSIVAKENELLDLYSALSFELQVTRICSIEWISPNVCYDQDRARKVEITFMRDNKPVTQVSYITPENSVFKTSVAPEITFCGDPGPGVSDFAVVEVTTVNSDVHVGSFSITPAGSYFSVADWDYPREMDAFKPFTIKNGEKRHLKIRFRQGADQVYRQALLELQANPCAVNIPLAGGLGAVVLESPRGGEILSTCDTVVIRWGGVRPEEPIDIYVSTNSGDQWILVAKSALGLSYRWIPPVAGSNYRVRVVRAREERYQWAKQLGGEGIESHSALAIHPSGHFIYVSGTLRGNSSFGSFGITPSPGHNDGFIARMDSDGNVTTLYHLHGVGISQDSIIGVITDKTGAFYAVGNVTGRWATIESDLGNLNMTFSLNDQANTFLAKWNPDGTPAWIRFFQGTTTLISKNFATHLGLRYNQFNLPEVIVAGRFTNYIGFGLDSRGYPVTLASTNQTFRDKWVVSFSSSGELLEAQSADPPVDNVLYCTNTATDTRGCEYVAGTYSEPLSFGEPPQIILPVSGVSDVFVSKKCNTDVLMDSSPSSFEVKSPVVAAALSVVEFLPTAKGQQSTKAVDVFCNTGEIPVSIDSLWFSGPDAGDFSLLADFSGTVLQPTECLMVEIACTPSRVGSLTALLNFSGACNVSSSTMVEIEGLAPCQYTHTEEASFGLVPLNGDPTLTLRCILRNTGELPLPVELQLNGSHAANFSITPAGPFVLQPGECLPDVTITLTDASSVGLYVSMLNYLLPTECGSPATIITADVRVLQVEIGPLHFGMRRIGTANTDKIYIRNRSDISVALSSMWDATPNPVVTVQFPTFPVVIPPLDSIGLDVLYIPEQRITSSHTVVASFSDIEGTVTGLITGIGEEPELYAPDYQFLPTIVGLLSPEVGSIFVKNADDFASLFIESISDVSGNASFTTTNLPAGPLTISKGETTSFPVRFQPIALGTHCANVYIIHDARPGAAAVAPYMIDTVRICGIGINPPQLPELSFGDVALCTRKTLTLAIPNPVDMPITVTDAIVTGSTTDIVLEPELPWIVNAKESFEVTIHYEPQTQGLLACEISFVNDVNIPYRVALTGRAVQQTVQLNIDPIKGATVGERIQVPISLTYQPREVPPVGPMTLTLSFNGRLLIYESAEFLPDFTLESVTTSNSTCSFTISPIQSSPFPDGRIGLINFSTLLTGEGNESVTVSGLFGNACIVVLQADRQLPLTHPCAAILRIVEIGGQMFSLQASPDSDGNILIDYVLGIPGQPRFEVYDLTGRVAGSLLPGHQPTGSHYGFINAATLSAGMYMLRMHFDGIPSISLPIFHMGVGGRPRPNP